MKVEEYCMNMETYGVLFTFLMQEAIDSILRTATAIL